MTFTSLFWLFAGSKHEISCIMFLQIQSINLRCFSLLVAGHQNWLQWNSDARMTLWAITTWFICLPPSWQRHLPSFQWKYSTISKKILVYRFVYSSAYRAKSRGRKRKLGPILLTVSQLVDLPNDQQTSKTCRKIISILGKY